MLSDFGPGRPAAAGDGLPMTAGFVPAYKLRFSALPDVYCFRAPDRFPGIWVAAGLTKERSPTHCEGAQWVICAAGIRPNIGYTVHSDSSKTAV